MNNISGKHIIITIFTAFCFLYANISVSQANKQALRFGKFIHNFGKFSIKSGPQTCTFEFENISDKPVAINDILSSCGCTTPEWPKKPVMPGERGTVKVTFLNDQGPYPFDKSLTVYTSASAKPIILRITGAPFENNKTLKDQFPVKIGVLGIKNNTVKTGQLEQGESKTKQVAVANLSDKPVTVKFTDISPGLSVKTEPETIPAKGTGEIIYTVDTKVKEQWGYTLYKANVLCNGEKAAIPLSVESMIIDNFSHLNKEEKNNGPMVIAKNSSYNFGTVSKGEKATAIFNLRNTGYRELKIYKADDNKGKLNINYPSTVKAGEAFNITVTVNTAAYSGEHVFTVTLITNSPGRPLVNLFITVKIR